MRAQCAAKTPMSTRAKRVGARRAGRRARRTAAPRRWASGGFDLRHRARAPPGTSAAGSPEARTTHAARRAVAARGVREERSPRAPSSAPATPAADARTTPIARRTDSGLARDQTAHPAALGRRRSADGNARAARSPSMTMRRAFGRRSSVVLERCRPARRRACSGLEIARRHDQRAFAWRKRVEIGQRVLGAPSGTLKAAAVERQRRHGGDRR